MQTPNAILLKDACIEDPQTLEDLLQGDIETGQNLRQERFAFERDSAEIDRSTDRSIDRSIKDHSRAYGNTVEHQTLYIAILTSFL